MRLQIAIGLATVIGGFLMKAALDHNIDYWGPVKTWTIVVLIFGLILILGSLLIEIDSHKPNRFIDSPGKWIINRSILLIVFALVVGIVIKLEDFAVLTNRKVRDYYLSQE